MDQGCLAYTNLIFSIYLKHIRTDSGKSDIKLIIIRRSRQEKNSSLIMISRNKEYTVFDIYLQRILRVKS